jgi:hypothetical protein
LSETATAYDKAKRKGLSAKQFMEEWREQEMEMLTVDQYNPLGMKIIEAMVKEVAEDLQVGVNR